MIMILIFPMQIEKDCGNQFVNGKTACGINRIWNKLNKI